MDKCQFCGAFAIELRKEGYFCKQCGQKQKSARKQYTSPFGEDYGKYAKKHEIK